MKDKKEASKTKAVVIVMAVLVIAVIAYAAYVNIFAAKTAYPETYIPKPYDGNATAKVVLTEYSDFQCPACGYAEPIIRTLRAEYRDSIAFRYVHFPLTNLHPNAFAAAEASECANDQGKFWEYHDKLFENQNSLGKDMYIKLAEQLNLNITLFRACIDSDAKKDVVNRDLKESLGKNLQGTPSFFVNDKQIEDFKYENLKKAIEEALKS